MWSLHRHLAVLQYSRLLVPGALPIWCQAGSVSLWFRERLGASRQRLNFVLVLSMSHMSLGSILVEYLCLLYIVWRKRSVMVSSSRFFSCMDFGRVALIRAWAMSEVIGWDSVWLSILFSFMIFIASLRVLRLRTFRPPAAWGLVRIFIAIGGGGPLFPTCRF